MRAADTVTLGGGGLDRQAWRRGQAEALRLGPDALALPFWRGRPLVHRKGNSRADLVLVPSRQPFVIAEGGTAVFLGDAGKGPVFAVDTSGWTPGADIAFDAGPGRTGEDQPVPAAMNLPEDAHFGDLRGLISGLSPLDAEIAVTARGILEWHRTHGFCARCGSGSISSEGGWRRDCPSCGAAHFPRTDPVVIMLVIDGNRLLLGRSPGWPDRFYSLLAGFMEPGETVAAAVRREVEEETGVRTGAVRMLASQPWPFPASLMIGCIAEATSREIRLDPTELDDALWITREGLLSAFAGKHASISPPRRGAIAHFLMQKWLADDLD